MVERARIILACLEGKEIQQLARELRISIPSVSKWRQRFSPWGLVRFATGCWRCWWIRRRPVCPTETGRLWRKSSTQALMPSGVFYAAKGSICKGGAAGM